MSTKNTGFGTSQKQDTAAAPGPPFSAASAANGLSVDAVSGKIVLGNNVTNVAGGLARLLSNREIDTGAFSIGLLRNFFAQNFTNKISGDQVLLSTVAIPTTQCLITQTSLLLTSGSITTQIQSGNIDLQDGTGLQSTISLGSVALFNAAGNTNGISPTGFRLTPPTGGVNSFDFRNNAGVFEIKTNVATVLSASMTSTGVMSFFNTVNVRADAGINIFDAAATNQIIIVATANPRLTFFNGDLEFYTGPLASDFAARLDQFNSLTVQANISTVLGGIFSATVLQTGNPGGGQGLWKLGKLRAGAVAMDAANYVEVDIDGVVYKLLKAV